ncbi:MAG: type IV pilus secretin PilQ [Nitrospirota bacterium]|jgi:type IV pilus assembly protein PilQ
MRSAALALIVALALAAVPVARAERGPLVSMELRNVEIRNVLRAVGQEHGINIVADDTVVGKVTVSLREVPLWDALDSILKSKGYTYRVEPGGVVVVGHARKAVTDEEDVVVREFKLKYIKSAEVLPNVNGLLSQKGTASVVGSTNSIVVKDLVLGIERVEALLERIDQRPKQVMIEARIVEMSTSYNRELGVRWGRSGYVDTDSAFGRPGSFEGRFAINLPKASAGGGSFILGTVVSNYTLDLELQALEDSGEGKVLSQPKIMVLDNQEAEITSGTEILVPSIINSTGFGGALPPDQAEPRVLQANLALTVTPRVVEGDLMTLVINTMREEFDFARSVQGFPPKESRTAKTELLVSNGETVVIGGIYTKNKSTDEARIPLLGKIPVLGWLFKSQVKRDDQRELLIFLTPTIVPESQEQWSLQTP